MRQGKKRALENAAVTAHKHMNAQRTIFPDMPVLLRAKLTPPLPSRQTLARPRVNALLANALNHRVTLIQAGAGYGKSTALAQLVQVSKPLYWFTVSESDSDPRQFLAYLISAFHEKHPELVDTPLVLLQERGALETAADALLNALANALTAPSLLVVDDYHLGASSQVNALLERILTFAPHSLHTIIAARYLPEWDKLLTWRVRGEVLDITREQLAFTCDEIAALFGETYDMQLAPHEIELLAARTEGWPIALQLIRQELRANPTVSLAGLFEKSADASERTQSSETLFAYLAHDVLAKQPPELQSFLLETSILRELDSAACNAVTGRADAEQMLAQLVQRDLFVSSTAQGRLRHHHLFEEFLRETAAKQNAEEVRARHERAAAFYERVRNHDEALFHLFAARAFEPAARLIETVGEQVLREGRLDAAAAWIAALPHSIVAAHPFLIFMLGELARLHSRYNEALAWYAQAEREGRAAHEIASVARALRGQALVYLDTVRPAQAEDLLQEALRLTDGLEDRAAHARLLELLAENKLNMGRASEAEELRLDAQRLREEGPSEDTLSVRVKLRTGRLDEARAILERWAEEEQQHLHAPRAARETLLILSLIYSLQGDAHRAFETAQQAISLGIRVSSPFVTGVGYMRLAHANQIRGEWGAARECYSQAVALSNQLALPRLRAEALWGMTRLHAYEGDLQGAKRSASEGIAVARAAGDEWVVALVQLTLGAAHVLARQDNDALAILNGALGIFQACGDQFGRAVTQMWLALAHWHGRQRERALAHLDEALALAEKNQYDYVFTTRTLHGWHDPRVGVPLLLEARRRGLRSGYVNRLLAAMNLEHATAHPGYALRVQTLGTFQVWRGDRPVQPHEWQRRKARQLFQLLLTYRGRWLEREEIYELLWANEDPTALARDLKVAWSQINHVLEPDRAPEDPPAFLAREATAYGIRTGADLWVDADEFTRLLAEAEQTRGDDALDLYRRALALYHDDYLGVDARYEAWASAERERLLGLYLRAADRLAAELYTRGALDECLTWCERILARDPCWEHAYRLMMRAHAARGDRAQARRVFDQCVQTLRGELAVEPSPETIQVLKEVTVTAP